MSSQIISDLQLLSDYKEYKIKNGMVITNKQSNYIINLYNLLSDEDIKNFGGIIDKIKSNELDDSEIFGIIETLKKYAAASFVQILSILKIYDKGDIKRILGKEDLSKISIKDAELLLGGPEKFKPWIKEHPQICEDEWEYGWQESQLCENGKLFYLKFYNMLMIDIDTGGTGGIGRTGGTGGIGGIGGTEEMGDLISNLKKLKDFTFRVYKTFNGYHVFIVNCLIKYNDPQVMEITRVLKGDLFYVMFAHKTGFKVRLSKKIGRSEEKVCEYICDIGTNKIDETCKELIIIHDRYNSS